MLALLIWGKGINEYKFMQVQQDLEIHSLKIHELADWLCIPHTAGWDTIFSHIYLLERYIDLIEILEIMPQMWQYVIFLSLKPTKVTSDFILN